MPEYPGAIPQSKNDLQRYLNKEEKRIAVEALPRGIFDMLAMKNIL